MCWFLKHSGFQNYIIYKHNFSYEFFFNIYFPIVSRRSLGLTKLVPVFISLGADVSSATSAATFRLHVFNALPLFPGDSSRAKFWWFHLF